MQVENAQEPRGQERLPDAVAGFRVVRRLATGGTSDVLLARANGPNGFERTVVLKLLLAEYKDDPSFERMFAVEAAAYARLSHPSIVKLYDFFATGDQLVMVLEYVDGLPLNALRAELTNSGEVLEDRAVFYLMSRVFAALSAAHAARDPETREFSPVIHRDVNPSNVLIHRDGSVKLADFGIAKVTGMAGDTKTGFIKGTFGYMSPEQVRGEQITVRADVYAATLLLWELLARRRAIQHGALSDLEALRAMAHPNIVSLDVLRGDLSASLRKMIARGLEPTADNRGVTAAELAAALEETSPPEEGRARLIAALEKARAPDDKSLLQTAPSSPSVAESMARLAEADLAPGHAPGDAPDDAPPLPSYSVPAPPLSDMDMADTTLQADAISSRRPPQKSVPDDIPTKPAHESEIAQAISADDSLELPRFPMPSMSEGLSDAAPRRSEPKTPPKSDPKAALDHATEAPPSSRRNPPPRLGGSIAPRPAVPRPMSVAPPSSQPPSTPKPTTLSGGFADLKPPSSKPSSPKPPSVKPSAEVGRPKTIMGGFVALPGAPPTEPSAAAGARTAPMAIVPSALASAPPPPAANPLSTTLAMAAPHRPNATSPAPLGTTLPIVAGDRNVGGGGGMFRNAMPTAPASFAPRPSSHFISPEPSRGTPRRGWLLAAIAAFAVSAVAIAVLIVHLFDSAPVAVGAPTIVVASAAESGMSTRTQPNVGPALGNVTGDTAHSAAAVGNVTGDTAHSAAAVGNVASAQPNVVSATPPATVSAATSPVATPPTAPTVTIPAQQGAIVAGKEARQHRVFVDGKNVGEGPGTYFVSCGNHVVKIGSSGKPRDIDIACGTSINVP